MFFFINYSIISTLEEECERGKNKEKQTNVSTLSASLLLNELNARAVFAGLNVCITV